MSKRARPPPPPPTWALYLERGIPAPHELSTEDLYRAQDAAQTLVDLALEKEKLVAQKLAMQAHRDGRARLVTEICIRLFTSSQ